MPMPSVSNSSARRSLVTLGLGLLIAGCSGTEILSTGPAVGGDIGVGGENPNAGASGGTSSILGGTGTSGAPNTGGSAGGGDLSTGGSPATGGKNSAGGYAGTGGSMPATGGRATGGFVSTGGNLATGGLVATGGTFATGGATLIGGNKSTGGAFAVGGTKTTGGAKATGGSKATGGAKATGGMAATGGSKSTGGGTGTSAPTWTQLYTNYFATGTAGNCASCHGSGTQPTFNSAATLCAALKNSGYIGNGTATLENLLKWFNNGGGMPANNNPTPANAVADITAWQNAGAVCP